LFTIGMRRVIASWEYCGKLDSICRFIAVNDKLRVWMRLGMQRRLGQLANRLDGSGFEAWRDDFLC
jgi:hypothetical protein